MSEAPIDLGGVLVDPLKLIDTRMLVCANSGGGKSRLIRCLVEQVIATIPTIILDREGEFATLRERFDVVLVGGGGEVQTATATAAKLARRLVELRVSAVIDLSDLKKPDKRKFVRLFLEALLALPRSLWSPTLIVLDEAHEFAPEAGRDAESRDAVIALMDQGRKRGFGGILATQRLSKLAKDAAGEANNLCIGRFAQDLDLARASGLLGFSGKAEWKTMRDSLPGEFYAVGPAFEHGGVVRFRSGAIKTSHPSAGQRASVKPPAPSKRILGVAGELADLQQQVEAEANELETLRDRNRELESALAKAKRSVPAVDPSAVQRALVEGGLAIAQRAALPLKQMRELHAAWGTALDELRDRLGPDASPVAPAMVIAPPRQAARTATRPRVDTSSGNSDAHLGQGGERKMLVALAQHPDGLDRSALGLFAGLSATGGTFAKYLSNLKGRGWVETGRVVTITEAGVSALGSYEPLPTGRALVDYWLGWVGQGGQRRMLEAIVDAGSHGLTRAELGAATGIEPSGGTFAKYLSELRTAGLVEGRDRLRAAATLREAA